MTQPTVPGYRLETLLGQGLTGATYRAIREADNAPVALKILSPEIASNKWFHDRLAKEFPRAKGLSHAAIARPLEMGQGWIASQLAPGMSAAALIQRGPVDEALAVEIAAQIAGAIEHAAKAGLVHGEIKPANIVVSKEAKAVLTDFAVARAKGLVGPAPTTLPLPLPSTVAPERIKGGPQRDVREDLYALGATLFEMATGRPPFAGRTIKETLDKATTSPTPSPAKLRAGMNDYLDAIVRKLLQRDPAKRYQTPTEAREDLEALLEEREPEHVSLPSAPAAIPKRASRRTREVVTNSGAGKTWLFVGAAAVLVVAGAWFVLSKRGGVPTRDTPLPSVAEKPKVDEAAEAERRAREEADKRAAEEARRKTVDEIRALLQGGRWEEAGALLSRHQASIEPALQAEFHDQLLRGVAQSEMAALERDISDLLAEGRLEEAERLLASKEAGGNRYLEDAISDKKDELVDLKRRRAKGGGSDANVEAELVANARRMLESGQTDQAFRDMAKLAYLSPENVDARFLLIQCEVARGRTDRALVELERFMAAQPNHDGALRLRLDLARQRKEDATFVAVAAKLLAKDARNVPLRVERAEGLRRLNKPDEALKEADEILKIDPKNDAARRIKIDLLLAKGARTQVIDLLSQEIDKNPRDPAAYYERALAYVELGELDKAEEDFKKVQSVSPGYKDVKKRLDEMAARAEGPVREHELTPTTVLLFDGKSQLGWIPNEQVKLSFAGGAIGMRAPSPDTQVQLHDIKFQGEYTMYVATRASMAVRGPDNFAGIALGYKPGAPFYLLHWSSNHFQLDLCNGSPNDRRLIAKSSKDRFEAGSWQEFKLRVAGDQIEVTTKKETLIPATKLPNGPAPGQIAVVLRTGADVRFRWIDVDGPKFVEAGGIEARSGLHYDRRNKNWKEKGKWSFGEGVAAAEPTEGGMGNLVTIQHKTPKSGNFELDVELVANIGGAGYALIFFDAYGKACALGVGRDNQRREVLAVGQMGSFGGQDVFYNNFGHAVPKPGPVTFGARNRYRIIVLTGTVEVWIGDSRVFSESKSEFLSKLDHATNEMKDFAKQRKTSFRLMNFEAGFGAWDASARDDQPVRAEFYGFQLKPIE
jgi:tetratricopeptide (TPR) repeat protein